MADPRTPAEIAHDREEAAINASIDQFDREWHRAEDRAYLNARGTDQIIDWEAL